MQKTRISALVELVNLTRPLADIANDLRDFAWDSEEALAELTSDQVVTVFSRYLAGELSDGVVQDWANAIEGRDDIDYQATSLLEQAIHELANPLLTQPLSMQSARDWVARLSA